MGQATRTLGALPPEPTPLVGRDRELERVLGLLDRGEVRLLTLTGPGGVGKTRLAARAAAAAGDRFADGVCFVPLESIAEPSLVPAALALRLGLSDIGERSQMDEVMQHLAPREVLLVLDGFEHLLDGAPALGELLSACERLKLLVTSRAILRLSGEQEFPVRPLPVGAAADSPAVALFLQRAAAVEPDFRLSEEGREAVASICSRLDGLPLAIELAAARVRLLRPEAMLARLARRFELLTGGPRDAPARHQTMRDTVAWSYGLLEPGERRAFRLLAAFAGGCSLEAAEQVAAAVGAGEGLLETLASLADKSMLVRMEGAGGDARVGMLETLRAFAHDELVATGELAEVQDAHAAWCMALAAGAEREACGPDQTAVLDALEQELPNIRAALRHLIDAGRHADALTTTCDLHRLWFVRGHMSEGRRWIQEAVAGLPAEGSLTARGLALEGTMAFYGGDLRLAADLAARALAASAGVPPDASRAAALAVTGLCERAAGRYPEATAHYAEAAEILRGLDRPSQLAETLARQAIVAMQASDVPAMRTLSEEAVRLARRAGDVATLAYAITPLAMAMMRVGEFAPAAALLDEALAAARALGNRRHASRTLWATGRLAAEQGKPALALFEECCALCREFGDGVFLTVSMPSLAGAELAAGRPEAAVLLIAAARADRRATGSAWIEWMHRDEEAILAAARAALGEERFAALSAEGAAMTPDEAFVATRGAARADDGAGAGAGAQPAGELTARETEVLALVARGLSDAQVAAQLVVSRRTVHAHLRAVYRKLDVGSRHAATRWALEHGLA